MAPSANSVVFHFQDPSVPGTTLLDALADAAHGAERGGGIFAFASAQGIATFLDDPVIEPLTKTTSFELVLGMDAITDTRALSALVDRLPHRPGLNARVLIHELPALFHPKLCWFVHGDAVTLVVGSGNLTPGGLTKNLEAFTVAALEGPTAAEAEASIAAWFDRWEAQLFAPDAPEAKAQAEKNSGAERSLKRPMATEKEDSSDELVRLDDESAVLVFEVPRNAPGRMQLNVSKNNFEDFFGGVPGSQKRILIQHVEADGSLAEVEPPRAVFRTSSRNFRFEVAADRTTPYPAQGQGRPIAVFVRRPDGIFRYRLLWPGGGGYPEMDSFLTSRTEPAGTNMRREPATVAELRAAWPNAPLLPREE
jgi:hypothetical protein